MAQNLGSMGEKFFNFLCSSENINCNPSQEDMAGWDYILDFPLAANKKGSDVAAPPIECKIQIKSTTKTRKYSDIKLSNLLRFCKSPLPNFILFIEFDDKKTPQRLYLVHFDDFLIKKSLIAIRKAEQSKIKKKINNSVLRITYDNSHLLPSVDGRALKERIESYIPEGLDKYALDKIKYSNSVGFETGSGVFKFSTKDEESFISLIEASIGIDKEIEISDVTINESRFGIELASPLREIKKAKIKIIPSSNYIDIKVRFRQEKYGFPIEFPAQAYIPTIPDIPQNLFRVRIKTAFFEFIIRLGDRASTYQMIHDEGKHSLESLMSQIKILNWMCFEKRKLFVDFISEIKPELTSSLIITPSTHDTHSKENEWKEAERSIERIIWIATRFKLESHIRLTVNEVFLHNEKAQGFYNVYNMDLSEVSLTYSGGSEYNEKLCVKLHTITFAYHLYIGGALMVTIVSFQGYPIKNENNEYSIPILERIIEKEMLSLDKDNDFLSHVRDEINLINKKYKENGLIVVKNSDE